MELAIAAPFGLLIGSFLNVLTYRLPRGESLLWPASRCTSCGHAIRPWDNVPVLSWLVLRGRCRSCRVPISPRYPLVEVVTALTFAAIVLTRGMHAELLLELPFAALLIAIAGIDLEHQIVPNKILLPAAVFAIAAAAIVHPAALPGLLVAGAAAFLFFLLAALAYPAGMGMGDVKLAGVMGLYLGLSIAPALLIAFLTGTVAGLVVIARSGGKSGRTRGLPFAPFLALGGVIALLAGPQLIDLYTHTFLH